MEKMTLHLPEELFRAVVEAAERQNRSREDVIRDALAAYVERPPRTLPRSIGAASGGGVSAAESKAWVRQQWLRAATLLSKSVTLKNEN